MKAGIVQVEGVEYRWSVYRQPSWSSSRGPVGMALLIETMENSKRELLVEFSADPTRHKCMISHQRIQISNRRLIECIQNAIKAGWNPNSRGKRFIYDAGLVISN
jgi:hypothetical protein